MSFWKLTDGTKAESNETYESSGGDLTPIPDKTGCIAAIEEAKWDSFEDDSYISLKWRVARPAEYANRVIFQKLKVFGTKRDKDPKAASDKAKRMLAAIDANAGGKLMKMNAEPSDQELMTSLMGKMMAIKVMVWRIKGEAGEEDKKGNWISAVSPAKSAGTQPPPKAKAPIATLPVEQSSSAAADDLGDIPF